MFKKYVLKNFFLDFSNNFAFMWLLIINQIEFIVNIVKTKNLSNIIISTKIDIADACKELKINQLF